MQNAASVPSVSFTPFAAVLPFQQGNSSAPVEFISDFAAPDTNSDPEKPPPLPEKKNKHSKQVLVWVLLLPFPFFAVVVLLMTTK